ncbi:MAG TPA: sugar phosphate isomerase/epimerase [Gemmatimonadaceae bacterium]
MSQTPKLPVDRRAFLRGLAGIGGAALATAYALPAWAESLESSAGGLLLPQAWRDQIGLQLFTVRDRFVTDYAGTLEAVAKIGYRQVQPTMNYGGKTAAEIKAILDRNGLTAPATHVNPPNGADFEKALDDYALMGHKYTTVNTGGEGRGRPAPPPAGAPAAAGPAPQRPPAPPQTVDSVKRTAEALNAAGRITQKHGIKVIVHNHTVEFAPLADSSQRPYDVLLAETDPSLVAMELDIGWATVAGADPLALFKQAPGRFEAWHVKDMKGLTTLAGKNMSERQRAAQIVPVGQGEIDYKPIFAQAKAAGMKYFFVEQDSAPASGDSLAAAATSYRALSSLLA